MALNGLNWAFYSFLMLNRTIQYNIKLEPNMISFHIELNLYQHFFIYIKVQTNGAFELNIKLNFLDMSK